VLTASATLVQWALRPLHEHEQGQPVIGFLLGLDALLQAPGDWLTEGLGLRGGHHTHPFGWAVATLASAALWCLGVAGISALLRKQPVAPAVAAPHTPGPRVSRRGFLTLGVKGAAVCAGAGLGYGLVIEPRRLQVSRHAVNVRDLPAELDGLRLVQLTDIHHGPWLSLDYVRRVVAAANALEPDVVCLTGDYVHLSPAYVAPVVAELARLRPRLATVAVLGNHDWWEGVDAMRRAFADAGIPLIDNDRRVLTPDGRLVRDAKVGLALCGVGDLWEDRQDYARALGGLPAAMPRILLSHNPDVAEEPGLVRGGWRVDLMLSGHTHGGQIRIPGLGTPVSSSRYGQKYSQGFVEGPACRVFVCRGIGVSGAPLRFGVPPEIAVLELHPAA
jgi:predicted MPP superfamily phosphohydrolase